MNLPNLTGDAIKQVGAQIVADLRENLREAWNQVSERDREQVHAVANDLAKLGLEAAASSWSPEALAYYQREAKHAVAAVANLAVARQIALADAIAASASHVFSRAAQVAATALTIAL